MLLESFVHPEALSHEMFFSNANSRQYSNLSFKTKRKGNVAYDGNGGIPTAHENNKDWFPVFVKTDELMSFLLKNNASLQQFRRDFAKMG